MNLKPRAQESAWNKLVHLARSSNGLPQALIFHGPEGIGKKKAAAALFQFINCANAGDSPCGECAACTKISRGNHTDWLEVRPEGATLSVDDLREMFRTLNFSPMESPYRFVVIDQAQKMSVQAANALLKTLEEPPKHTRFILIANDRSRLLPTILSRCQSVAFEPLMPAVLEDLLKENGVEIPGPLRGLCTALLGDGMARAELFKDEKVLKFLEAIASPSASALATADEVSRVNEPWALPLYLDTLVYLRRRNCQLHLQSLANAEKSARNAILDRCYDETLKAMQSLELSRAVERNANKKLVALTGALGGKS